MHWIEFGEEGTPGRDGTPIVFVHGLGGSHLNWCLIGPELAAGRRAVALDLHGFGLTPGTRATSTVQRNTRLLDRFVREVTGTPVILAGNSMGGLISILHAVRRAGHCAQGWCSSTRPFRRRRGYPTGRWGASS